MSAIITDQLRILNSENFVAGIASTTNSYYAWIGLPNPADFQSDWSENPPAPKDSFSEENDYWDTMIALKKLNSDDIARVVRKITGRQVQHMKCIEMIILDLICLHKLVQLICMTRIIM